MDTQVTWLDMSDPNSQSVLDEPSTKVEYKHPTNNSLRVRLASYYLIVEMESPDREKVTVKNVKNVLVLD